MFQINMRIYLYILLGSLLAAQYGVSSAECDSGSSKYKAFCAIMDRLGTATNEWTGGGFDSPDKQLDFAIKLSQAILPLFGVNAEVLSLLYLFSGDGSSSKDPVINFMRKQFKIVNAKIDILKESIETLGKKITWEIYAEGFADTERALSRSETLVNEFVENYDNYPDNRTRQRAVSILHNELADLKIYPGVEKLYAAAVMESSVFGGNLFDLYYNHVTPDCSSIPMFGVQVINLLFRGAWYSQVYMKISQDFTKVNWGHRIYLATERMTDTYLNCLSIEVVSLPATINSLVTDPEVKPSITRITTTLNKYLQPIEIFMMEKAGDDQGQWQFYGADVGKGQLFHELTLKNYDMTILYTYTAADGLVDEDVKQDIITEIEDTPDEVVTTKPVEIVKTFNSVAENEHVQLLGYFNTRRIAHHPEPDINEKASYNATYGDCKNGKGNSCLIHVISKTFYVILAVEPVYKTGYNCDECEQNSGTCQKYSHIEQYFCRCPFNTEGVNCEKRLSGNDEELEALLNIIEAYKVPTLMVDIAFVIDESTTQILDSIENVQDDIMEGIEKIVFEMYFLDYIEDVGTLQNMAGYMQNYLDVKTESPKRKFLAKTFLSIVSECDLMNIKNNFERYLDVSDSTSMYRRYTKEIETNDRPVCSKEYTTKIQRVRSDMFKMQELVYTLLVTEYSIKEKLEEVEVKKETYRNFIKEYEAKNKELVEKQKEQFAESSCPSIKNKTENIADNHCEEYDFLTGNTVSISCSTGYAAVAPDGSCISSVTCDSTNTMNHENSGWEIECIGLQEGDFNLDVEVKDDQFTITRSTADKLHNMECLTFGVRYKLQTSPTWNTPIQEKTAKSWTYTTTLSTDRELTFGTYEFEMKVYLNKVLQFTKSKSESRTINYESKGDECRYDLDCSGEPGLVCRGSPSVCICDSGYIDRPTECIREIIMQSWASNKRGGYDGVDDGTWGPYVECGINQYVFAIKLRSQEGGDDKGITDIRMYCAPYGALPTKTSLEIENSIISIGQNQGNWNEESICETPVVGIKIKAEELQAGLKDDQGITKLEVRCQDDEIMTPIIEGNGDDGTWQDEERCNEGEALVGFKTRIYDTTFDKHGVSGMSWSCRRYE